MTVNLLEIQRKFQRDWLTDHRKRSWCQRKKDLVKNRKEDWQNSGDQRDWKGQKRYDVWLTDWKPKPSISEEGIQVSPCNSRLDETVKVFLIHLQDFIHFGQVKRNSSLQSIDSSFKSCSCSIRNDGNDMLMTKGGNGLNLFFVFHKNHCIRRDWTVCVCNVWITEKKKESKCFSWQWQSKDNEITKWDNKRGTEIMKQKEKYNRKGQGSLCLEHDIKVIERQAVIEDWQRTSKTKTRNTRGSSRETMTSSMFGSPSLFRHHSFNAI